MNIDGFALNVNLPKREIVSIIERSVETLHSINKS
nr:MAG TPA: hypothetical protein [Bacteriophage sp.]